MSNKAGRDDKPLNLASLLFGSARRDVLALLLLHPELSLHVRELARATAKAPGTVLRELNLLADGGVLVRTPIGNQVHFQANPACPIFEELRGIMKKTAGIADVLRSGLEPLGDAIRVAFVYGSVARGDERGGSDLDLMIVGDVTFAGIVEALQEASNSLRREINPHLYPPREFARKVAVGDPFLSRVMEGEKIFVIGDAHDLGKPAAHRKA
jgi:predicted nucleotidyltransferase